MKTITLNFIALLLLFASCTEDKVDPIEDNPVVAPATYSFLRGGVESVQFGGQTTRIAMASELINSIKDNTKTEAQLDAMFAHVEGSNDFSSGTVEENEALNSSSKSVRSKTAASMDYFSTNSTDANSIKADFDGWIANQVTNVFPNWATTATAGNPGKLQQAGGGSTRYINGKGLEYNQAFAKSLIGALMTDQILNNYLSLGVLDAGDNRINNDNDVITSAAKPYTTMEHKWDEAYGYLYGAEDNQAEPVLQADSFLNKYLYKVEVKAPFAGIAADIFNAFKLGRAAIVAKNYTVRDEQIQIIKEKISKVIGVRAVHYLQAGIADIGTDYASSFHNLSEGFGFVYSLQFTRKPNSDSPYVSKSMVDTYLSQLMTGNGFWDVTPATLNQISDAISQEFDFTTAEAAQ